jgi:hypothetical protein
MLRQTTWVTPYGRDAGGEFLLAEKPAVQATEWFLRATQLLVRSGADVPPNIFAYGPMGFAALSVGTILTGLGKAPWAEVKPLLDELLGCVASYRPPGAAVPIIDQRVIRTQIAEPATLLQLYEEVVSLHLGFSIRARLSGYRDLVATMMAASTPSVPTSEAPLPPS